MNTLYRILAGVYAYVGFILYLGSSYFPLPSEDYQILLWGMQLSLITLYGSIVAYFLVPNETNLLDINTKKYKELASATGTLLSSLLLVEAFGFMPMFAMSAVMTILVYGSPIAKTTNFANGVVIGIGFIPGLLTAKVIRITSRR